MCSAFTPDSWYDNRNIQLTVNVYCPNTMCSDIFGVHEKTFQSLGRSHYQFFQCSSTVQVRNIPCEEQTYPFYLKFDQGIFIFEETQISIQDFFGDVYFPKCPNKKCICRSTNKTSIFYDSEKCKICSHLLNIPLRAQKPTIIAFSGDVNFALQAKRVATTKKRNHLVFCEKLFANHNQAHPSLSQKRHKSFHLWHNCVDSPVVDAVNQKIISIFILYTSSLQ